MISSSTPFELRVLTYIDAYPKLPVLLIVAETCAAALLSVIIELLEVKILHVIFYDVGIMQKLLSSHSKYVYSCIFKMQCHYQTLTVTMKDRFPSTLVFWLGNLRAFYHNGLNILNNRL